MDFVGGSCVRVCMDFGAAIPSGNVLSFMVESCRVFPFSISQIATGIPKIA